MKVSRLLLGAITGIMSVGVVALPITANVSAAQTGWVYNAKTKTHKYYDKSGKAYTGWHWMTSKEGEKTAHWSYFGNDGVLRTGWQQLGRGTNNPDGDAKKHWSYFGSNGWLRTGWVELGSGTKEPDGNKARHFSYFGSNGWLRTGLQNMGMGTNNPDGKNPFHKSYFGNNGWLLVNNTTNINGVSYKADSRGWLSVFKGNNSSSYIGESKAKSIALRHAGVSATGIREYKWELDYEYGQYVYEIEFKSGRYEYDYDINAINGNIVRSNREYDD